MSGKLHNLLHHHHNTAAPATGATHATPGAYSGLNMPYTGGAAHPTYGYQRLAPNQKAERFEMKAAEYERRGNMAKAQKNREKALRYRARTQPGYQRPVRPANYYNDRATLFDRKAAQYQQWGMAPQAQRYQGRAQRIRAKHNITAAAPVVQREVVNAPIIQETVRQDTIVQVQPVIHREVDKNIVHHVEKHIQEAPAPNMGGVVELNPLIQQQVHTNVMTEVQPIIHREVAVPVVQRTEQHLTQHIVEPTIHTHEVVYEKAPLHTTVMPGMQAGALPMGQVPLAGQVPMAGQVPLAGQVPMAGQVPLAGAAPMMNPPMAAAPLHKHH